MQLQSFGRPGPIVPYKPSWEVSSILTYRTFYIYTIYRTYKIILNKALRKAERAHYNSLFENNRNNLNKSWRIIKDLINKNNNKPIQSSFLINNEET